MKAVYFDSALEAEQLQKRLFDVLSSEHRLTQGTVRYSEVYEDKGRYYIFVLDEHVGYLTEEERCRIVDL